MSEGEVISWLPLHMRCGVEYRYSPDVHLYMGPSSSLSNSQCQSPLPKFTFFPFLLYSFSLSHYYTFDTGRM